MRTVRYSQMLQYSHFVSLFILVGKTYLFFCNMFKLSTYYLTSLSYTIFILVVRWRCFDAI